MAEAARRVIVITRNGKTTVIRGWRAWVFGAGVLLGAWLALGLIVFLLVGVAITAGVVLLLLVPALTIVALLNVLMRREPCGRTSPSIRVSRSSRNKTCAFQERLRHGSMHSCFRSFPPAFGSLPLSLPH
jgi:hypothetical protein